MHPSKALYISKVEMPADVGNSYCDMYLEVLIYLLFQSKKVSSTLMETTHTTVRVPMSKWSYSYSAKVIKT